jgi:RecB family exonuclease
VWYLDQFRDDPAKTFILANGKPAVELSFSLPITSHFSYAGHFDRIAEFSDRLWVTDYKTSKSQLNASFFSQFKPSIQFAGYVLAGQIVFQSPVKGVIVDAVQLAVSFSDFARQQIQFSPGELDEFVNDLKVLFDDAERYAERGFWPMNPTSCHHYGGCAFRKVCSHPPHVRENFLRADFIKRMWNPAQER